MVGVAGFEPTASWSRTKHATICATPRQRLDIIYYYQSKIKCFFKNFSLFQYIFPDVFRRHCIEQAVVGHFKINCRADLIIVFTFADVKDNVIA